MKNTPSGGIIYKIILKGKKRMKNGIFRILCIGDIVGKCGLEYIKTNLWRLRKEYDADLVIANGENSAPGNGITKVSADTIFMSGADVITTGNHVFRRNEVYSYLDDNEKVLRPANYPKTVPGFGYGIFDIAGIKVLVMNLLGTVYMESLENPFETASRILEKETEGFDIAVCDFHAEATSEKAAFAHFFDGRINVVFGTHTHVQTNDAKILANGTGFITDVGMTGPYDSVLGVKTDIVIKKFTEKMPVRFDEADGKVIFNGAIFDFDTKLKKVVATQTINLAPQK